MRALSRFFKAVWLTVTERTKLWLIAAVLVIVGIGLALENVQVTDGQKTGPLIQVYAYQYDVLLTAGFAIILASGLNLVNGHTGQFSLGHAGFMAVGAYVASAISLGRILPMLEYPNFSDLNWMTDGGAAAATGLALKSSFLVLLKTVGWVFTLALNAVLGVLNATVGAIGALPQVLKFPASLIVGGLMAALAGLLVGVPSLRLRGDYLAIVTLGFNEIIRVIFQNYVPLGSQTGLTGIPLYTSFISTFVWAAITIYVIYSLVNSTYGRGFLAVRDDEIAAEAMGINTTRYKVLAFVIAAFFAGVAGGLYAHFKQFINADGFNFIKSVDIVVMVIIGGMGSIWGVTFAAVLLTILPEALRKLGESQWVAGTTKYFTTDLPPDQQVYVLRRVEEFFKNRMIFFSLILIIVMLLRPQGLFGVGAIKKKPAK
jgi:branched-chain amino acid transport system permease protein